MPIKARRKQLKHKKKRNSKRSSAGEAHIAHCEEVRRGEDAALRSLGGTWAGVGKRYSDPRAKPKKIVVRVAGIEEPRRPPKIRGKRPSTAESLMEGVEVYSHSMQLLDFGQFMAGLYTNLVTKEQRRRFTTSCMEAVKAFGPKCNLKRDKRWEENSHRLGFGGRHDSMHLDVGLYAWETYKGGPPHASKLYEMAREMWSLLEKVAPEEAEELRTHAKEMDELVKSLPEEQQNGVTDFQVCIPGTCFTGGYIGTTQSVMHTDSRDRGVTCLLPLATQWSSLSILVLSEYKRGFRMQPGDVVLIKSEDVYHGSTKPILPV